MADATTDLNDIITSAVQARIEAQIAAAFTADSTFETFVIQALQQEVEIPAGDYRKKKVPFLMHLIQEAVRKAATLAVKKYMAEHTDELARAVEAELSNRTEEIAKQMVAQVSKKAGENYGVRVELAWPERY